MFDSHCHLDDPDIDATAALDAFERAGARGAMIAGYGPERFERGCALCQRDPRLRLAVGLHPWWQLGRSDVDIARGWAEFSAFAQDRRVAAIGELGMDRTRRPQASAAIQQAALERGLWVAADARKPVILHVVGWHGHTLAALREVGVVAGGVVHRFGGPAELIAAYTELGLHLSVDVIAFRRSPARTLELAKQIPLQRLVLETDWPERDRTYADSLAELATLHDEIAAVRGMSEAALREQLWANNAQLYRL